MRFVEVVRRQSEIWIASYMDVWYREVEVGDSCNLWSPVPKVDAIVMEQIHGIASVPWVEPKDVQDVVFSMIYDVSVSG